MKILVVAEGRYPDFVGGAETAIYYLTRELATRGHEVHTLTRKPRRDLPSYALDHGVHVHRYPGPPVGSACYWLYPIYSSWGALHRFVKLNNQIRFDAVLFNQPFPAVGILSFGGYNKIRKVYLIHSVAHVELRTAVLLERYALSKCEAIATLSRYMKDMLIRLHGETPERIRNISVGVDSTLFTPIYSIEQKHRIREALEIPEDAFVLFAAKRLDRDMGLENLINAIGLLADDRVLLLIAGDGRLRKKLEKFINGKPFKNRIRLVGSVPHSQMVLYYRSADLFISTRPEPCGLVTLEALACSLPVLSVPLGGTAEILEGLSKDLVFEDASSSAMADVIGKYMNSPGELMVLGSISRRYVEDNYRWCVAAGKMEKLLSEKWEIECTQ